MRRLTLLPVIFLTIFACAGSERAAAGPYADDMAKCLVKSTSPEDRTLLVKWIFSVISLHPDLSSMSVITAQQRDAISKGTGVLFQRLLVDSCRSETQQAIQNEGPQTIQYAFQVLGQVATRGLFTDPQVQEGMKAMAKSIDEEKIKALLNPATPK
jgi:hypothetical protein